MPSAIESWEPESPFLSDMPPMTGLTTSATAPSQVFGADAQSYSPFVPEYEDETGPEGGPRAQAYAALVAELSDTEFSEALEDLVAEATAVAEDRMRLSGESEDSSGEAMEAEQAVRTYLEPIARAAEQTLESMADRFSGMDLSSASESEVESLMEQFTPPEMGLSPVAEEFIGGLVKKAKKLASKVASVMPHAIILKKLAKLVRPLLERVLKSAINRLPVALRPIAQNLAKRFLGSALAGKPPMTEAEDNEEEASIDPAQLESELDAELAGYVMEGESFESEAAVERAVADELSPRVDQLRNLKRARKRFAKQIVAVKPDEPVEPVVEEFVPAILAALKLGISVVGRPKVVSTLAGFVANFIKKYVGEQPAKQLSGALVDTGLKLIGLEVANEAEGEAAGYALGATVEDTIVRLVRDAPEAAFEAGAEPMLHSYALEAFQQAATANFPDAMIKAELHESSKSSGAWIALPRGGAHKSYKKYSRVLEVTISPQAVAATRTYGGIPLKSFLRDRLGVNVDGPIQARVHLYEAIPGTSLSVIALGEKTVPLLGTAGRASRSLIHPLTPEAATALLGEPALGRAVGQQYLARRGRVGLGQRFYFLEIQGARVRMARRPAGRGMRPARSSQPRVVLDFPKRELRLFLFFSETDAQQLAAQLRKKASPAAIVSLVKTLHETMIKRLLATDPAGALKIIHEAAPTEQLAAPMASGIVRMLGSKLADRVRSWVASVFNKELTQHYDRFSGEFVSAASNDADGVTLQVTFQAPPMLEQVRRVLKGGISAVPAAIRAFAKDTLGSYKMEMKPGFSVR